MFVSASVHGRAPLTMAVLSPSDIFEDLKEIQTRY
jgi:hypothetical protein